MKTQTAKLVKEINSNLKRWQVRVGQVGPSTIAVLEISGRKIDHCEIVLLNTGRAALLKIDGEVVGAVPERAPFLWANIIAEYFPHKEKAAQKGGFESNQGTDEPRSAAG